MVEAIDGDYMGNSGGDGGSYEDVDEVTDEENDGKGVEVEHQEGNDEDLHRRAWKEASQLYWDAVGEIKMAIQRIFGCGGLQGQLVLFEDALKNLEFNVEMWKAESPVGVLSQEKFALFQSLVYACDAALNDIVASLYVIQENDEHRFINENGKLVYIDENGNHIIITEGHNQFEDRRNFVMDIISILYTARKIVPDIYELE